MHRMIYLSSHKIAATVTACRHAFASVMVASAIKLFCFGLGTRRSINPYPLQDIFDKHTVPEYTVHRFFH
ncbi:hypothetical protein ERO13_A13G103750v2 [Gossypium hirsutum]|uniref:Uncharacterized protein n=1 Tax=Gossypium tomentosum TaxID=34277 RepID=A0A5D2MJJ9_GOSTO|nr:hypothetical protein ERO13_A13G103750v2 [Gossypium hirsutum]KAG4165982.1 hypothetical protein ERO13_A13G103750v2 [Gossypium hirsutum]KAG4165983.1 hypothetical protein ERO13_A13G103750v2 [Gossypium hirsutum]KAG4165984.1 hypothetical protein ERO13_A13G103750v2 [Gossypium hirsutum]TYH91606.1 hypothetical protein ES332_A13G127200v1 [Gossypium tomentosum]